MVIRSNKTWRLIIHPPDSGAWLMAVDEALAYSVRKGHSVPVLRLYRWKRSTLSLGYFQRLRDDVNLPNCRRLGIPLVRRITGGRAILHDNELTYSVAAPLGSNDLGANVRETYSRISAALVAGLRHLGIPSSYRNRRDKDRCAGKRIHTPVCFNTLSYAEVSVYGKKLVGSAQKRWTDGFLQHGAIPFRVPVALTHDALRFDSPGAKNRSMELSSCIAVGVHDFQPALTPGELARAIAWGFEEIFGISFTQSDLTEDEKSLALDLSRHRYGEDAWTMRC